MFKFFEGLAWMKKTIAGGDQALEAAAHASDSAAMLPAIEAEPDDGLAQTSPSPR